MTTTEKRTTEQLKLRLSPQEAESIRDAASASDKTISEYIWDLHSRRMNRMPEGSAQIDALYRVTRQIVSALGTEPLAVSKLIADLGRMSGRLKELFEIDYGRALSHQDEINETLREVRAMRSAIDEALGEMRLDLVEPRDHLVKILGAIDKHGRKRDASA